MPATATATNPAGTVIRFDEATHTYSTDLIASFVSVTTFVKHYFPPFDADLIAARVAKREGTSVAAVKAEWEAKRDAAARLGTRVHEVAEDAVLGRAPRHTPESERERALMAAAWGHVAAMRNEGWTFMPPEQIVFSEQLHIAGTIDLPARDRDGRLWLLDWKTNERIDETPRYGGSALAPVGHLGNCNYIHYSLQLATYARLLRVGGYTDEVPERALLHVTESGVQVLPCADVWGEVAEMLLDMHLDPWHLPF